MNCGLVMKVTVKLFETLKDIVGSGKIEVNVPEGTDVESLLEKLNGLWS